MCSSPPPLRFITYSVVVSVTVSSSYTSHRFSSSRTKLT